MPRPLTDLQISRNNKKNEGKMKQRTNNIKKRSIIHLIYFWVLIGVGVMTLAYFLKTFALILGVPLAINEIMKVWSGG